MAKKLNNTRAQRTLIKEAEDAAKKVDYQRWLKTPEGEAFLILQEQQKKISEILVEMKVGQRVWKDAIVFTDDPFSIGDLGNVCCKVTAIHQGFIEGEMLFVSVNGNKFDEYSTHSDGRYKKGDILFMPLLDLEKHIAKNGNIWWKVKTY